MRLLDRYSILDRVGSGGMATIYRAQDDRLNRVVCVKLLRTMLVEESDSTGGLAVYKATYTHFLKEALALSRLQHSNTLRIYDFGYLGEAALSQDQGSPFHVCEYLDGGSLESQVRSRGPLSNREIVGLLEGICGAVAEAHEHGILHRDIKPSNILFARVRDELVPKLADFGIAHTSSVMSSASAPIDGASISTVALFSPRWAAPEQLCGTPEGPYTDVYALALVIIFMLTGQVLFADEDVRTTFNKRVLDDEFVTARLRALGLPRPMFETLADALTANPDNRIADAPEMARRVREAVKVRASNSIAPFPVEAIPRPPEPARLTETQELSLSIRATVDLRAHVQASSPPRSVRRVQVHESLDLSFSDPSGAPVRFRVTLLPSVSPSVNVKGLSCFVGRQKNRPTSAVTVSQDSTIQLMSSTRQDLGALHISFGQATDSGRLFVVDGQKLLIAYSEAQQAVTLTLSGGTDIVVMCRS
jgi:serine/threonine-protein kinase